MEDQPVHTRSPAAFKNHSGTREREARVLPQAPVDAFPGGDGTQGLEPLLSLMADVLDMDLILVGHVNADEYTAVAWYSRNPDLVFEKGGIIPICDTYCREEITAAAPFAIGDAAADPLYKDHPGYTKMGLRAYVGVPLVLEDGTLFGTVCGVDAQPKPVHPENVERLILLAGMLSSEISRRLGLKSESETERGLQRSSEHLEKHLVKLARGAVERDQRIRDLAESLTQANRAQALTIRRLRAANRELEEFTYTVSHDLSEPLRGIETLAEVLVEDASTAPRHELVALASRVKENAAFLKARVKGVLQLSRLMRQEFEEEDVDLRSVVDAVVESLKTQAANAKATIHVQQDPPLPRVRSQRARLEQLYANLVENAVKHNADRGVVVSIGWHAHQDGRVVHWVRDDGAGIPVEWRKRVFEVFRRGPDATAPGSGVGLAIVAKVVDRHEGEVWIEDTPGGGTTFCFTLPGAHLNGHGV